jgi:hypothetical protein
MRGSAFLDCSGVPGGMASERWRGSKFRSFLSATGNRSSAGWTERPRDGARSEDISEFRLAISRREAGEVAAVD